MLARKCAERNTQWGPVIHLKQPPIITDITDVNEAQSYWNPTGRVDHLNPNSISITGGISESQRVLGNSQLHFSSMETPFKRLCRCHGNSWLWEMSFYSIHLAFTWSRWKGSIWNLEKYRTMLYPSTALGPTSWCHRSHPSHIPHGMSHRPTVENPHGRRTSDFSLFSFSTAASLKWMKDVSRRKEA